MKRNLIRAVAALMFVISVTALAQPGPRGPRREEGGPPMMPQREAQDREFRGPPEMPQQGRMSPEERRQLRRDVHEAGKELYREPPGRGPRRPPNGELRRESQRF